LLAWFLRYSFSYYFCHHGSGGAAVDPSIQTEIPIFFNCKNSKSIGLRVPEIFTNFLAEDT
jgi:hypothetical protein